MKGWKGFVHSYKNYIENGYYDEIEWGKRTQEPIEIDTSKVGKIVYKW